MSKAIIYLSLAALVQGTPLSTYPHVVRQQLPFGLAPLHSAATSRVIENSYIVVLKQDVTPLQLLTHVDAVSDHHTENPLDNFESGLQHIYDGHIKGYAGYFAERTIAHIRSRPEVDYVEQDQTVHTTDHATQNGAPWGLARISHRKKLGFSTFRKYVYDEDGGDGVDVYVIDTGINTNHTDFEGRASWGKTMPKNDEDVDGNGHGTHCAGTIASKSYGVAKKANVIAVKVLGSNGSGTMSDVVGGVVWAAQQAAAKKAEAEADYQRTGIRRHKGSVANMSLGGGKSRALDDAVNAAVKAGMHFAVAAGNDNRDACDYSPAGAENAITVGATGINDARAYFSNFGKCVDVFAPGVNILSTWNSGNSSTNTISGTSMASPHTAGLAAYLLSMYPSKDFDPVLTKAFEGFDLQESTPCHFGFGDIYRLAHDYIPAWFAVYLPSPSLVISAPTPPPTITPEQLKTALIALGTKDMITDIPADTVNLLIFNNATM